VDTQPLAAHAGAQARIPLFTQFQQLCQIRLQRFQSCTISRPIAVTLRLLGGFKVGIGRFNQRLRLRIIAK
jgi:hypothetical protein